MSERSIYLREQADKCRSQANSLTDEEARSQLRRLAAGYIVQAVEIERNEAA
jgi:hypothetical protein